MEEQEGLTEAKIIGFWKIWKDTFSEDEKPCVLENTIIDDETKASLHASGMVLLFRCTVNVPIVLDGNILLYDCILNFPISCCGLIQVSTQKEYGSLSQVKCESLKQVWYGWKPHFMDFTNCHVDTITSRVPALPITLSDCAVDTISVDSDSSVILENCRPILNTEVIVKTRSLESTEKE